jgi:L-gulono-1,4-lactone dehydrogenase
VEAGLTPEKIEPVSRLGFVTRRKWRNVAKNRSMEPLRIYRPSSLEQLIGLVYEAEDKQVSIRAVGSGHSWSDVALTEGFLVLPDSLRRPLSYEPGLARVQSGMRIRELNEWLNSQGAALPNMGGFDGQTIAGVISTSTHGSGITFGPLSDLVRSIDIVAAQGRVYRIEPENGPTETAPAGHELIKDDLTFESARVGMGCLGLIYAVAIEVIPSYLLTEKRVRSTWEEERDRIHAGIDGHRHYELYLNPHPSRDRTHLCMVTTRVLADKLPWWGSSKRRRRLRVELLSRLPGMGNLLNVVMGVAPKATPFLLGLTLKALTDDAFTNRSYRVLNIGAANYLPADSAEIGVPLTRAVEAIDEVLHVAARQRKLGGVYHSAPIALRFVKQSRASMSMMHGRDTMMIELILVSRTQGGNELLAAYEEALYKVDGRPHWGQINTLASGHGLLEGMYDGYPAWLEVHRKFNSTGVFNSPFSKRVGISKRSARI